MIEVVEDPTRLIQMCMDVLGNGRVTAKDGVIPTQGTTDLPSRDNVVGSRDGILRQVSSLFLQAVIRRHEQIRANDRTKAARQRPPRPPGRNTKTTSTNLDPFILYDVASSKDVLSKLWSSPTLPLTFFPVATRLRLCRVFRKSLLQHLHHVKGPTTANTETTPTRSEEQARWLYLGFICLMYALKSLPSHDLVDEMLQQGKEAAGQDGALGRTPNYSTLYILQRTLLRLFRYLASLPQDSHVAVIQGIQVAFLDFNLLCDLTDRSIHQRNEAKTQDLAHVFSRRRQGMMTSAYTILRRLYHKNAFSPQRYAILQTIMMHLVVYFTAEQTLDPQAVTNDAPAIAYGSMELFVAMLLRGETSANHVAGVLERLVQRLHANLSQRQSNERKYFLDGNASSPATYSLVGTTMVLAFCGMLNILYTAVTKYRRRHLLLYPGNPRDHESSMTMVHVMQRFFHDAQPMDGTMASTKSLWTSWTSQFLGPTLVTSRHVFPHLLLPMLHAFSLYHPNHAFLIKNIVSVYVTCYCRNEALASTPGLTHDLILTWACTCLGDRLKAIPLRLFCIRVLAMLPTSTSRIPITLMSVLDDPEDVIRRATVQCLASRVLNHTDMDYDLTSDPLQQNNLVRVVHSNDLDIFKDCCLVSPSTHNVPGVARGIPPPTAVAYPDGRISVARSPYRWIFQSLGAMSPLPRTTPTGLSSLQGTTWREREAMGLWTYMITEHLLTCPLFRRQIPLPTHRLIAKHAQQQFHAFLHPYAFLHPPPRDSHVTALEARWRLHQTIVYCVYGALQGVMDGGKACGTDHVHATEMQALLADIWGIFVPMLHDLRRHYHWGVRFAVIEVVAKMLGTLKPGILPATVSSAAELQGQRPRFQQDLRDILAASCTTKIPYHEDHPQLVLMIDAVKQQLAPVWQSDKRANTRLPSASAWLAHGFDLSKENVIPQNTMPQNTMPRKRNTKPQVRRTGKLPLAHVSKETSKKTTPGRAHEVPSAKIILPEEATALYHQPPRHTVSPPTNSNLEMNRPRNVTDPSPSHKYDVTSLNFDQLFKNAQEMRPETPVSIPQPRKAYTEPPIRRTRHIGRHEANEFERTKAPRHIPKASTPYESTKIVHPVLPSDLQHMNNDVGLSASPTKSPSKSALKTSESTRKVAKNIRFDETSFHASGTSTSKTPHAHSQVQQVDMPTSSSPRFDEQTSHVDANTSTSEGQVTNKQYLDKLPIDAPSAKFASEPRTNQAFEQGTRNPNANPSMTVGQDTSEQVSSTRHNSASPAPTPGFHKTIVLPDDVGRESVRDLKQPQEEQSTQNETNQFESSLRASELETTSDYVPTSRKNGASQTIESNSVHEKPMTMSMLSMGGGSISNMAAMAPFLLRPSVENAIRTWLKILPFQRASGVDRGKQSAHAMDSALGKTLPVGSSSSTTFVTDPSASADTIVPNGAHVVLHPVLKELFQTDPTIFVDLCFPRQTPDPYGSGSFGAVKSDDLVPAEIYDRSPFVIDSVIDTLRPISEILYQLEVKMSAPVSPTQAMVIVKDQLSLTHVLQKQSSAWCYNMSLPILDEPLSDGTPRVFNDIQEDEATKFKGVGTKEQKSQWRDDLRRRLQRHYVEALSNAPIATPRAAKVDDLMGAMNNILTPELRKWHEMTVTPDSNASQDTLEHRTLVIEQLLHRLDVETPHHPTRGTYTPHNLAPSNDMGNQHPIPTSPLMEDSPLHEQDLTYLDDISTWRIENMLKEADSFDQTLTDISFILRNQPTPPN